MAGCTLKKEEVEANRDCKCKRCPYELCFRAGKDCIACEAAKTEKDQCNCITALK